MTCVWDGLIKGLGLKTTPQKFSSSIIMRNKITENVVVNGEKLSENQKKENFERISKIGSIKNGYLMSSFDPLLMLICELYEKNLVHNFNGHEIIYTNIKIPKKSHCIFIQTMNILNKINHTLICNCRN